MMSGSKTEKTNPATDDEIVALLPFYVSGRLDKPDQSRVEAWLEASPYAATALDRVSEELSSTVEANEALQTPAGALAKLNASIEEKGLSRPQIKSLSERLSDLTSIFDFGDRRYAWATALALLLVVGVQAGRKQYQIGPRGIEPNGYELAAGKIAQLPSGPAATVAFKPTASISEISDYLNTYSARIVSGPKGSGLYTIRFEGDSAELPLQERLKAFAENKDLVLLFKVKKVDQQ